MGRGLGNIINMLLALAIPGDVFGHVLTVYRQQVSNSGPGVADILVTHDHTSRHATLCSWLLVHAEVSYTEKSFWLCPLLRLLVHFSEQTSLSEC